MFCFGLQIHLHRQSLLPISKGWPWSISDYNKGQKHLWASEDLGKHREQGMEGDVKESLGHQQG